MHHQANGHFVLLDIGNAGDQLLSKPLVVSALQNLYSNTQEAQNLYDSLLSDMIAKAI